MIHTHTYTAKSASTGVFDAGQLPRLTPWGGTTYPDLLERGFGRDLRVSFAHKCALTPYTVKSASTRAFDAGQHQRPTPWGGTTDPDLLGRGIGGTYVLHLPTGCVFTATEMCFDPPRRVC